MLIVTLILLIALAAIDDTTGHDRVSEANNFLQSSVFWKIYIVGVSFLAVLYWVSQNEENLVANILSLN
jgi:hypothetical protein